MGCIYCDPNSFQNKGISTVAEKVPKKSGKWHKRVDGRYVRCSGKNTQTLIEAALEMLQCSQISLVR